MFGGVRWRGVRAMVVAGIVMMMMMCILVMLGTARGGGLVERR